MTKKEIITNWLRSKKLNVFATITLKKGQETVGSKNYMAIHKLSPTEITRTGWIIRDRVSKAVFGTRAFKNKTIPPFLVFNETDKNGRPHFHILTSKPERFTDIEYDNLFRSTVKNIDWVYNEINIQIIKSDHLDNFILYSLKTGFDAFIPEASFIPNIA